MNASNESAEGRLRTAYSDLAPGPGFTEGLQAALAETPQRTARAFPWTAASLAAAACLAAVVLLVPRGAPGKGPPPRAEAGAPLVDTPRVEKERVENRKAYEQAIESLRKEHFGHWVVIAGGRVVTTGRALSDVASAAPEAAHRFVFEVGKEGDREEFASQWYGPRFSGPSLAGALQIDWSLNMHGGTVLLGEDGRKSGPHGVAPFPRVPLAVAPPWSAPGRPPPRTRDVFIGSVGPPLVLMQGDWDELGLHRFEIPGTMVVNGGPCRMAAAEVSVPELGARGKVVAACAAFPRERLVEIARGRDAFWGWAWQLAQEAVRAGEGRWIVFAVDRVVGEGGTVEEALRSARGKPDGYYHRYVARLPRSGAVRTFAEAKFTPAGKDWEFLNGKGVPARTTSEPSGEVEGGAWGNPLLVTAEVAASLGLEMTESAEEFALARGSERIPMRASYVWAGDGAGRVVRLVLYPPPEPAKPIAWTATVEPEVVAPGGKGVVVLRAALAPNIRVFAADALKVEPQPTPGVAFGAESRSPHDAPEPEEDPVWSLSVVRRVPFTLAEDVRSPVSVAVRLTYRICKDGECFPTQTQTLTVVVPGRAK